MDDLIVQQLISEDRQLGLLVMMKSAVENLRPELKVYGWSLDRLACEATNRLFFINPRRACAARVTVGDFLSDRHFSNLASGRQAARR